MEKVLVNNADISQSNNVLSELNHFFHFTKNKSITFHLKKKAGRILV
jgi:hypothetical protein